MGVVFAESGISSLREMAEIRLKGPIDGQANSYKIVEQGAGLNFLLLAGAGWLSQCMIECWIDR